MGKDQKHLIVVAGEASGDLHAAHLIRELKKLDGTLSFSGVGGEQMRAEGVTLYEDIRKLAVVGFVEVLKHFGDIRKVFYRILEEAERRRPAAVILVDYPGFNLRLAKELKTRGIKVIYYISPQVWAWDEGRIKVIKEVTDKMIVLFPFEKTFYARHGLDVAFVGHPLAETVKPHPNPEQFLKSLGFSPVKTTVGILPGSRQKEIERLLPVMLKAAETLYLANKNLQFLLMRAPTIDRETIDRYLKNVRLPLSVVDRQTYAGISASQVCMVASGTATLETAILGKPMVVVYKTSFISWLLARLFIRIPYIGLVNVVAEKRIVPECIQFGATPENIAKKIKGILADKTRLKQIDEELRKVRELLGETGAGRRAAEEVVRAIPDG